MYRQIRLTTDVTPEHIAEATDLRSGLYGGVTVPWDEVIDRIEAADEDWGSDMQSPAIRYLQKEVRRALRE